VISIVDSRKHDDGKRKKTTQKACKDQIEKPSGGWNGASVAALIQAGSQKEKKKKWKAREGGTGH
jgi:uncharacterized phage protein gp47/JayE